MAKHVAVLMGGWSAEREVSLRSGKACADALARVGYRVTRVDVGRDVATVLSALKPDVALNVLHGRPGEDGTLQGVLEILGIPYSHSGVLASALAMQKDYRQGADAAPPACRCRRAWWCRASRPPKRHLMAPPYVIKPIAEGSSVGVFIVTEEHAHPPQELTRDDWAFGEHGPGRTLHPRQGADLRGDGRPGARRDRDRADDAVLRLRGEIRPRRLQTRAAGANFTICLPRGPKTSACGASRARLPGREPRGLPLRRPSRGRRDWSVSKSIRSPA